jgi:P4 family phage/plasmid primase-like protien
MTDFNEKQLKELLASAIDRDIAELNIWIMQGDRALQAIFYALGNEERKNTGQVRDKWLRQYDPIYKNGGWAFFGVDPTTDERTECISFKPNTRLSPDRKYENPPKAKPIAFYPAVTHRVMRLVSDRFKVALPQGFEFANPNDRAPSFWAWVLENNIPIIITEGCKKALSAICQGFPCVAGAGVWNLVTAMKDGNGETDYYSLIPSLRILKDKKILIGFDRDQKARTIATVMRARAALASALIDNQCECHSIVWDSKYKGLDDLLAGKDSGVAALEQSISKAKPLTGEAPNFKKKIVKNMMGEDLATESKDRISFDAISKTWQIYTNGRWKAKGQDGMESVIYHRVVQDVPEINSVSLIPDIMKFMKYKLTVEEWNEASTLEFFPFKNGVWSFKDKKLLPHSPHYLWKWQLDRDYSPIATGWDSIDRFLKTATQGDDSLRDVLIAACAAVLHGRSDLQKAFHFFGSGANSKGTFMKLLEMLVGEDNVCATTLEALCTNKFETARIYNKRLVVCPDEDRAIRGASVFKSVVGEDSVRGEDKGEKGFQFTYGGVVVMASNDPIFMGDNTYGLSRKVIPIPFSNTISDADRRKSSEMIAEFAADLPFFTTYLLDLDQNWVTTTIKNANKLKAIKDLEWQMEVRVNSVAAFFEDRLILDPEAEVLSASLYSAYEEFCGKKGRTHHKKHENNFCPSLVDLLKDKLGVKGAKSRKLSDGKYISGVRLRTKLDPLDDSYDDYDGKNQNSENESSADLVTAMTAKTEKAEISKLDPKPPTSDRPIPTAVKVDDYIEYQIVGDRVDWLEIAFHKYSVAKEWDSQISLWGGQTQKPHLIRRNGKKFLLRVTGITKARLDQLLSINLGQPPQQPSRR